MLKRTMTMLFFFLALMTTVFASLSPAEYYNPSEKSLKNKVLGIERQDWIKILGETDTSFRRDFLDLVAEQEKRVRARRGADYNLKLDSENDPFDRYNPLFRSKRRKTRYLPDTTLSKHDFSRLAKYLPEFKKRRSDEDIAMYLPYVALCLNEGMKFVDVWFYIQRDAYLNTPIDIAIERLYWEMRIENGEI